MEHKPKHRLGCTNYPGALLQGCGVQCRCVCGVLQYWLRICCFIRCMYANGLRQVHVYAN